MSETVRMPIVFKRKTENVRFSFRKSKSLNVDFGTEINVTTSRIPVYDGEYEVIPSAHNDILLETAEKKCIDDITVKKITRFETANPGGGYTLYIAEME